MKMNLCLALLAGLLVMTSCNDDFLEQSPENAISDGAVWKTPSDLQLYVNNFYNRSDLLLRDETVGASCNMGIYTIDRDNGSDTEISLAYNTRMNGQAELPSTGGGWATSDWDALRDINYFFANYQKASGDEAEINRYVGEALFFRAIFYYNKLRRFGDVPWYDHLLNPDDADLTKARDPRNVVVDNLMADLDQAVAYLPSRGTPVKWEGRVNKETAMQLQARIALYEGTWEKYHALKATNFKVAGSDGTKFIEKARDVSGALIALGTCDLDNVGVENGYYELFNKTTYASSKEILFWRQYSISLGLKNGWQDFSTYGAKTGLSKRMVDMYLCKDGKPIAGNALYQGDDNLVDVVTDRDPRLNQTIYVNDGKHVQFPTSQPDHMFNYPAFDNGDRVCVTGYQVYKGHLPGLTLSDANSEQAMIYFRYAEALLINAEAHAELNSLSQAILDNTINLLRRRLNVSGVAEMADMAIADASIAEIRRERTVELAVEGFRVDDIFRWAAADELIKGYVPQGAKLAQWQGTLTPAPGTNFAAAVAGLDADGSGYILPYFKQTAFPTTGYNFDLSRDYLNPLPTEEIRLNPSLAPNNPGW
jgi:hypothetical protein